MSEFDVYRRLYGSGKTVGQTYKEQSDDIMEYTWDNDINAKVCYIYDRSHDDQPELSVGMTYTNTTKTKIDVKYMINTYGKVSTGRPELQIMFKPSQKTSFVDGDELYYAQKRANKYGLDDVFVGMYIDIPNKDGVYKKHLICMKDVENNQFQKYYVAPCDYNLSWITTINNKRIKNKVWCAFIKDGYHTNGLKIGRFQIMNNQKSIFLPTDDCTSSIWYVSDDNKLNQRFLIDILCDNPNAWEVSKVDRVNIIGITEVLLDQKEFNPHYDYIERDGSGKIIGMWGNYYTSSITPESNPITPLTNVCNIVTTTNTIKCGGSYKLLDGRFINHDGVDVSSTIRDVVWEFTVDGEDVSSDITIKQQSDQNKLRIKFDNQLYLNKTLTIDVSGSNFGETIYGSTTLNIVGV